MIHQLRACAVGLAFLLPALGFTQLRLTAPNGGEVLKVGARTTITWTGVAATDTVTLEYSTDNGVQWSNITNNATNLQYVWLNIPNTVSPNCLVRVSRSTVVTPGTFLLVAGGTFNSADFSNDGTKVVGANVNGNCYVWDSHAQNPIHTFPTQSGAGIPNSFGLNFWAEFSPDGRTFASCSPSTDSNPFGNIIRIFDATTGAKIREWNHRSELGKGYTSGICRFSPDGTMLAVTGKDSVYVFNVATGATVSKLAGFAISTPLSSGSNVPLFCDWNSTGTEIMVCAAFKNTSFPTYVRNNALTGDTIQTYWLTTNIPFLSLHGVVHFSPDGTRFLAATHDTTVRVWDVATGQVLLTIKPNLRDIVDAAFSHDGKTIVTVGQDSLGASAYSVKLWDATTGAFRATVGTLGFASRTVEFNQDDSRILVSAGAACVIFQNATTGSESDVSDGVFSITPNTGGSIVVYATQVRGHTNEIVGISLFVDDPGGAVAGGATQVTVSLAFNVTMLEPVGTTPSGTISNGTRTIPLTLTINPTDTLLITLPMRVALGNDSITKLDVISPLTNAVIVTAADQDGSFTLTDLCTQGGARLVNPDGVASIILTGPNPARNRVNVGINLLEDGRTSLMLADESGRPVRTIFDDNVLHGARSVQIPVADLPSGHYFLTLRTPTFSKTTPLEVAR